MNWKHKKILITGAGGFIGSHLTERMVAFGAETTAFIHYNSLGRYGWLDYSPVKNEVNVILGDITDQDTVQKATKGCDMVFHLAALIGIPYSYHAPRSYVRTNVEGTLNVLQAALDNKVEKVIHTSTSEVYGTAQYVPINEDHPLQGQSPYSATKIGADKIAESFYRSFNLPVVVVRPFNTYGPRQSMRAVIPTIINQCMAGDIVQLGDLTPTRDLNYVSDTVEGFIYAAQSTDAIGQVINIGSGREISIKALADTVADIMGKQITIEQHPERIRPENSEVERLCADNTRALKLTGWKPAVDLRHGLTLTIDWMEKHREHYRPHVYTV